MAEESGRQRVEEDDDDDVAVRVEHISVKSALACTEQVPDRLPSVPQGGGAASQGEALLEKSGCNHL